MTLIHSSRIIPVAVALIDFILNLAGLLLWLNWRSVRFDPLLKRPPVSLIGTLRRAEPRRFQGWQFLAALAGLLLFRAWLYWQLGSAAGWTPKLNLIFVAPAFRSHLFRATLLYSVSSFLRVLLVFYFWLLALAIINRSIAESDPIQKMLRLRLGLIARWPWPLQLVLPLILVTGLWMALHPLLVQLDITTRARSGVHLAEQGLLVGLGLYFSLKYLLPAFLFIYLLVSYVYFGSSPLWDFVGATTRNLLFPLRWLPLRIARLDLAPLVGVILILLLLHILPDLVRRKMLEHNLPLWPE